MYWNSKEKVYIPDKIIKKTFEKDQKIFDFKALEPEEFRVLMIQPFEGVKDHMRKGELSRVISDVPEFHYLIDPFSIDVNISYYRIEDKEVRQHPHPRFQLTALISRISLIVKPNIVDDLKQFMEYFQYQMMLPFLKKYLPRRRPLTLFQNSKDPNVRRVRRQIVKDWFAYVIWANRVKKVMQNDICPELFEEEIEGNKDKYERALARLKDPRDNAMLDRHLSLDRAHDYKHINSMVAPVIDEIYERRDKEQQRLNLQFYKNFLQKFYIIVKIESVVVELYENSRCITYHGKEMPSLRIILGRIRLAIKIDRQKLHFQILMEDIKILDALLLRNRGTEGGITTINETFAVKTGFFLDEDITDFFRRHEQDDSIFQNHRFDEPFSVVDRTQRETLALGEQNVNGIRINDRPRLHNYKLKGIEQDFTDYRSRHLAPDEIIEFHDRTHEKELMRQEASRNNFESFWKQKLGKLVSKGITPEEQKRAAASKRISFETYNNFYQDDEGRNILERCSILAEGDPVFLGLEISYNLFAVESERKAINLNLEIKNFRIEYANDLLKTLAETLFAYRRITDLALITIASGPEAYERKIQLWTPWYLVKQAFWIPEFNPHGGKTVTGTNKFLEEEKKQVAEDNAVKSLKANQKAIANLDRSLKPFDLKFKIIIEGLYVSLNTNYENKRHSRNRNLLQIKTDPFEIVVIKHGSK